jgi:hypothetical protein
MSAIKSKLLYHILNREEYGGGERFYASKGKNRTYCMIVDFRLVLPYTLGGIHRPVLMVFLFVMRKVGADLS